MLSLSQDFWPRRPPLLDSTRIWPGRPLSGWTRAVRAHLVGLL